MVRRQFPGLRGRQEAAAGPGLHHPPPDQIQEVLTLMADWSASQYLKFEDQRTRPARDLAAQIPLDSPRKVYDLGCGPGNSTETLMERFPRAEFVGVDSSSDMLDKARKRLPQVTFVQADLKTWTPPPDADVFYSNAT